MNILPLGKTFWACSCICDSNTFDCIGESCKLVLWDNETSEEKKVRMIQAAKTTTSLQTGVRLTVFRISEHATISVWQIFRGHPPNSFLRDYRFVMRRQNRQ